MGRNETQSVCPICLRTLPARRVEEKGNVYLEKECPEHGKTRTLIWEGAPDYWSWGGKHLPSRAETAERVSRGCPHDCGLCGHHRQRTCCVLLEVTQRCNLRCPVCFADAGAAEADPDLETISRWYDILREKVGKANIQLSGGEPTVRDDLPEIIRLGREKGFTFFQLNTNGLRLAREPGYARKLKEAGLSCVFLQFDGVTDQVYTELRGAPLMEEKLRAMEHCRQAEIGVVLVPVVAPEVNLDQVGKILDFAMERLPWVRGVHFQPLTYFGRYANGEKGRLTLPRLLREIEAQSGGRFRCDDFSGGSAEHSHCSFSGNFLLEEDGTVRTLKVQSSCCCGGGAEETAAQEEPPASQSCCRGETDAAKEYAASDRGCCCEVEKTYTAVEHTRDTVARRWGAPLPGEERPPEDPDSLDAALYQLSRRRFSISAMAFQDCWSLDLERLQDCYIHVLAPDGRLIPFCSYNLTNAEGRPLYRGLSGLDRKE